MPLHILGDPHFSALQPWRLPLGDAFLKWFRAYAEALSKEQNSLLCLGDYSDDAVNPGLVFKQLKEFADIARENFDQVYFMVGNHDLKMYKNSPQLSFEFVAYEGITILREPAEVLEIEGMKILSLPHYNFRTDIPSMWQHYGDLPQSIRDQHFDLTVGHFSDNSAALFDHLIDISYLNTDHIALGHQHIRSSSHYTGSLYPCKISESESPKPRAVWVYEKLGVKAKKTEVPLPVFGEYRALEYPKPLPPPKAMITIYTVLGCESEKIAREFYGNIYIRGIAQNFVKKENNDIVVTDDTFVMDDPVEVLNEYVTSIKTPITRSVVALLRKMLAKPVVPTN